LVGEGDGVGFDACGEVGGVSGVVMHWRDGVGEGCLGKDGGGEQREGCGVEEIGFVGQMGERKGRANLQSS